MKKQYDEANNELLEIKNKNKVNQNDVISECNIWPIYKSEKGIRNS